MTKIARQPRFMGKNAASLGSGLASVTTMNDPTLSLIRIAYDVAENHHFARMDEDEKLWNLTPFVLTKPGLSDVVDRVENVTMNDAQVFANRVLAVLNESENVIEVKGQRGGQRLTHDQAFTIESCIRDIEYAADEQLMDTDQGSIDAYGWEQITIRGRVGQRIMLHEIGGRFHADIQHFDMRNCVYEYDRLGLNWVAFARPISKSGALAEYGIALEGLVGVEWWYSDRFWIRVFLDNKLVWEEINPFGYPPVILQTAQAGTFLGTSERSLRMQGDSIFGANRDLYPHWNAINTIMQTMNYLTLNPPTIWATEDGEKLPEENPYGFGRQTGIKTDEKVYQIDLPDIQASNRNFQAIIGAAQQRGSLAYTDWGNLAFQLSNVALATLGEAAQQVYTPRLFTMARFRKRAAMMMIDQMKRFDLSANIGRSGEKNVYTAADLAGEYSVDYKYFTQIPEETAAAYGLAEMQRPWLAASTIREDTLHLDNPKLETDKWLAENASQVSTALALFVRAKALEDLGKKDQARLLLIEAGQILAAGLPQEIASITGTEGVEPSEPDPAMAAAAIPPSPTTATRSTRQVERPGVGEFEQEVPSV